MRLNSDRLQALAAVASQRSFSKAAKLLGVTQSALSQRVQKLEEELETTLLVRDPSEIRLTETGEQLVRYCNQMKQIEDEVLERIRHGTDALAGSIRIGAYSSITRSLIIPSLKSIAKKYPHLQFEIASQEISELLPMLRRGQVDYILLNHEIYQEGYQTQILGYEENVFITPDSKDYPNTFLDHDPNDPTTFQFFQHQDTQLGTITRSYFDDIYGIVDAVKNGLGQAVVSKHLLRNISGIRIQKGYKTLKNPIVLVNQKMPYPTRKHEEVIRALAHGVPKLLQQTL